MNIFYIYLYLQFHIIREKKTGFFCYLLSLLFPIWTSIASNTLKIFKSKHVFTTIIFIFDFSSEGHLSYQTETIIKWTYGWKRIIIWVILKIKVCESFVFAKCIFFSYINLLPDSLNKSYQWCERFFSCISFIK